MNNLNTNQIVALYLSLFSDHQINQIISAVTGDPGTIRELHAQLRASKSAPPAILAIIGDDRNDRDDVENMTKGAGFLFYSALKGNWDRASYRLALIKLFGVSEAVAEDYAKRISTDDHEATTAFLARMAKKAGDFLLGPLYDPDTAPPNPDILYEIGLFGKEATELAKRVTSVAALFEGLLPTTMGVKTNTGLPAPMGDVDDLPDEEGDIELVGDVQNIGRYLDAYSGFMSPEALNPNEMGAAKKKKSRFRKFLARASKVVKKIARAPIFRNALKMIPGVGNIVSAVDTVSSLLPKGDPFTPGRDRMLSLAPTAVNRFLEYGDLSVAEQLQQQNDDDGGPLSIELQHQAGEIIYPAQRVLDEHNQLPKGPRMM